MTRTASKILEDMLALPESDRFDIVAEVLARTDGAKESDWESAWLAELDRREQSESVEPTPDEEWSTVRARIVTGTR